MKNLSHKTVDLQNGNDRVFVIKEGRIICAFTISNGKGVAQS